MSSLSRLLGYGGLCVWLAVAGSVPAVAQNFAETALWSECKANWKLSSAAESCKNTTIQPKLVGYGECAISTECTITVAPQENYSTSGGASGGYNLGLTGLNQGLNVQTSVTEKTVSTSLTVPLESVSNLKVNCKGHLAFNGCDD